MMTDAHARETMSDSSPDGADHITRSRPDRNARRSWVLIAICLSVALLLLAATAGRLLGQRESGAPAVPGRDSVDVGFAQDMSVHHLNAVQMASWARDNSTDPAIRQLAYDIESGQTAQIGQMQGWLSLWEAPTQSPDGYMRWMVNMADGMGHVPDGRATMPGMATSQDLARLRATPGLPGDVLFLQLMLRHHQGGADMLRYAAEQAQQPQVRNLAKQMLTAQTAETRQIQQMLADQGAPAL